MPLVSLPHTFHDGTNEIASGAAVMDNFNALKGAIDGALGGHKVAFGQGTLKWSGAGTASEGVSVATGLTVVQAAVATPIGIYAYIEVQSATAGSVSFSANAYTGLPAGTTHPFYWIAIGE